MSELRFLTAGESHGARLTAILEGIPAGVKIDRRNIDNDLARRQQGYGRGDRMKIEKDKIEIFSGVRFGETIGSPITLSVKNKDWENWKDRMAAFGDPIGDRVTAPRPGHADLAGILKFDRKDIRDILERSSARETTMRVAVGAVCKEFLRPLGISVKSKIITIGGETETDKIRAFIDEAKLNGDTLGGIFQIEVENPIVGLGSHIQWDKRLDGKLAQSLMSIQAIKGVEIGAGFESAVKPGSDIHDEIFYDSHRGFFRKTNRAGGLEGGMTNGEKIVLRAAMKPIPTLMRPLRTVDIDSHEERSAAKERSDTSAVEAASVVGEAMTAFTIAQAILEKFGGDSIHDVIDSIEIYRARISKR